MKNIETKVDTENRIKALSFSGCIGPNAKTEVIRFCEECKYEINCTLEYNLENLFLG